MGIMQEIPKIPDMSVWEADYLLWLENMRAARILMK